MLCKRFFKDRSAEIDAGQAVGEIVARWANYCSGEHKFAYLTSVASNYIYGYFACG